MSMSVLFLTNKAYPCLSYIVEATNGHGAQMDVHFVDNGLEFAPSHLDQYNVLLLDTVIKRETILQVAPRMSRLQWIHTLLAGVEAVPCAEVPDVPLTNSRGVYKHSLAEFAIFGMLFFGKNIPRILQQQRERKWNKFSNDELTGKTVGILSYGAIGEATAVRARAHGMRVIATRRNPSIKVDLVEEMYGPEDTTLVMSKSDYVVCCSPITAETRLMIGEEQIRAMKPNCVFINVGRGWVVDEPVLIRALQDRKIRGAALDVFQEEPLPESSPLWDLDNVLLSPHCTDNTLTWKQDSASFFVSNLARFMRNEPLENLVDKKVGY